MAILMKKNGSLVPVGLSVPIEVGITPTGNINITDTNQTDVTNYATAQVVDANLVASNIKKDVSILGVQGSFESGASLNIEYNSTTAPSDTSKLWVKTNTEPSKVSVKTAFNSGGVSLNSVGTLSNAIDEMACGVVGTKCYLFGGGSGTASNAIQVFDTETNQITTIATTLSNSAYGIACGVVGTKCYLFGGRSSNNLNTIQVFDTETNQITTIATTLSNGACGIACGVVGTKCYLFGGRYYSGGWNNLNKIQVFDTETNQKTTLTTTLPTATGYMACGVVGTKCYLFGGANALNTIQVFDTKTNQITTLTTTLPNGYNDMPCGVVGTKCYLFGGINNTTGDRYNTIQVFDTETNQITTLTTTLSNESNAMACGVVGTKCYLFGGKGKVGNSIINLNTINCFTVIINLTSNEMLVTYNLGSKKVKIINASTAEIEVSPSGVYIGDSNNQGQYVRALIYDETNSQWVEIN